MNWHSSRRHRSSALNDKQKPLKRRVLETVTTVNMGASPYHCAGCEYALLWGEVAYCAYRENYFSMEISERLKWVFILQGIMTAGFHWEHLK